MPKLIRDRIPEIIAAQGREANVRVVVGDEFWQFLKQKLREEADEFIESESPEELADIAEVLQTIIAYKRFAIADLKAAKEAKVQERGGFTAGYILE
jgi:predicted house-cleaning noncanonical NTP pyrophosphatase (MazG superfamily)